MADGLTRETTGDVEDDEPTRLAMLASLITSEAQLQAVLDGVDPSIRQAVEAVIRPHTKIPVS